MKKSLAVAPLFLAAAVPADATGGLTCRTAAPESIDVSLVIGHATGSPLVSARMRDGATPVKVRAVQWWLDASELRLLLVDPGATRAEAMLKTRKNGRYYDGTLMRSGRSRWVRCRES